MDRSEQVPVSPTGGRAKKNITEREITLTVRDFVTIAVFIVAYAIPIGIGKQIIDSIDEKTKNLEQKYDKIRESYYEQNVEIGKLEERVNSLNESLKELKQAKK